MIYGIAPAPGAEVAASTGIIIDFQNGVYTVDGSAVAYTDLIASTADYPTQSFDSGWISAGVGLVWDTTPPSGTSHRMSFTGEAKTRILAGATIVFDFTPGGDPTFEVALMASNTDRAYLYAEDGFNSTLGVSGVGTDTDLPDITASVASKLALTFGSPNAQGALDGSISGTLTYTPFATPTQTVVRVYSGSSCTIRSIKIYDQVYGASLTALTV